MRFHMWRRVAWTVLASMMSLVACLEPLPGADAGLASSGSGGNPSSGGGSECTGVNKVRAPVPPPVVNGTRTPTLVPLDAEQQMAVVGIKLGEFSDRANCSGTLIADRFILTALHCTENRVVTTMQVLFGADDLHPVWTVRPARKHEHPDQDLSILELDIPPASQIAVRPIPITLEDLAESDVGSQVEQSGFGLTNPTTSVQDGRFFVVETLNRLGGSAYAWPRGTLDIMEVNGAGQRGVCGGDSGGPSLRVAPAGDTRVLGALHGGQSTCTGKDEYTRVDLVRSWVEGIAGPTPGNGPVPCGSVSSQGTCDVHARMASWCDVNQLKRVMCPPNQTCGWSPLDNGNRCIPTAQDPCQGIGRFGRCDGGVLTWCNNGQLVTRPCMHCGEHCGLADSTTGYACLPGLTPSCAELGSRGACQGSTAQWCEADQFHSFDCPSNDCRVAPHGDEYGCLCGNTTYEGSCQGDVVVWCREVGILGTFDCAAHGRTCGYIDAQTGYWCR